MQPLYNDDGLVVALTFIYTAAFTIAFMKGLLK